MSGSRFFNVKTILAIALVIGAAGFLYARYQKTRPPAPPARSEGRPGGGMRPQGAPGNQGDGPGRPTEAQRQQFRQEMYETLEVTPGQRQQMEAIESKYAGQEGRETMRERMREMNEILTPEQREKARESFMQRGRARIQERVKMLPPEEQQKFMEKLEERMERWGERRGPGGPDGPGGERGGRD
ncbi:hypothetical protein HQ520_16605 [bacterium]|nr:hypothetical protein [bacterium]